ncbi:MAG: N-acetylmuramoyl-L-alanine amidase [Oscillospiraceae bacterium]|nr:N-acetylmuramoyl-L-alanine amidase [Oscillospiraceae bacterium]
MIILRKNKIVIGIICCVMLITIVCVLKDFVNINTVKAVIWDKTGKVVILDAGHGFPDLGATSSEGVTEADINLEIVLKVEKLLKNNGIEVILTRKNGNCIADLMATTIREKKNSDLKNRVKIGNNSNADIFVSIHLNAIPQEQYWGFQTFYKNSDDKGKELAKLIQSNLKKVIDRGNKREALVISNKYLVDNIKIPICMVECGFLSNKEEAGLLQQDEYQNKLAQGITNGILEYFRICSEFRHNFPKKFNTNTEEK